MSSRWSDARLTSNTGDSRSVVDYYLFVIPVDVLARSIKIPR
jgi:hypothetical protein